MADLMLTPVATEIKPVQGMSLADMINTARGIQAYQQAQQTNPLELQRLQAEANVAQQTQQPRISAAQSQAQTAETGSQSAALDFANKQSVAIANRLTPMINHPLVIAAEQNPGAVDPTQIQGLIRQYGEEQAKALGIPSAKAQELIQPYLDQQPGNVRQFLKDKLLTTLDQGTRAQTIGGIGVSTQPVPTVPAAPGNVPQGNMSVPYPVRSSAAPFIPQPSEEKDKAAGEAYRNSLVNRQTTLTTDRRNVEETIGQAQKLASDLTDIERRGGLPGQIGQKLRSMVYTDDYKMLSKDLANLQISNLRALGQGGNTVAGMDLTKVASGDVTVPPDVLIKIARRAQADMTNLDMQANGAEQFKNRYGDNNMNAFKQAWNSNADSKIFEAMNIIRDVTDPAQKQQKLKELFPNANKYEEFLTKYRNIKKLSETGSL
jgi:hypothetical protein